MSSNNPIIFYDNHCNKCIRFVFFIKKIDFFKIILFIPLRDVYNPKMDLDIIRAEKEMACFYYDKWYYGFDTVFIIVKKIHLLKIMTPIFYILKKNSLENKLYSNIAIRKRKLASRI